MFIGVLRLEYHLHGNDSLKGKRRVAASLKQKMRTKFNVAVSEVESQDDHARLVLAAVTVGPDTKVVEGRLQKTLNMVEAVCDEDLVDSSVEIFSD
ncbi:MAG: DUF503 domain-containing protein [Desulfovibrio sp.]|uniref:DUF503 domain-containing protein n=1 Tax=Desulfovibrio sp. 7SRBS1 TaxID=3378064 RepID=UPI003B3DA424